MISYNADQVRKFVPRPKASVMGLPPTAAQQTILAFFRSAVATHGVPPSIRQIGAACGLSSSSTVFLHLQNLVRRGHLRQLGYGRYTLANWSNPVDLLAAFASKYPNDPLSIEATGLLGLQHE